MIEKCKKGMWLKMIKLVLVRHGQSMWNLENKYKQGSSQEWRLHI